MAHLVISRDNTGDPSRSELEDTLAEFAFSQGLEVLLVPDLYHLPEDSALWPQLAGLPGPLVFFSWLHPRPAEWLLRKHGVAPDILHVLNLADCQDTTACLEALTSKMPIASTPGSRTEVEHAAGERWYPLIDGSRCQNCGHCLQFCLFGVYEKNDEDRVTVTEPDNCKPGCPACARVCPASAIVFPLYHQDAAIAGAPGQFVVMDEAARRMYYTRTGLPCPCCGQVASAGQRPDSGDGEICPECGRRTSAPVTHQPDSTLDEIDALIDELDHLTHRETGD